MKNKIKKLIVRLHREESGAVAMEYVIIGLLVAAAAVAAVTYFGRSVSQGMDTLAVATTGKHTSAGTMAEAQQADAVAGVKAAEERRKQFHDEGGSESKFNVGDSSNQDQGGK